MGRLCGLLAVNFATVIGTNALIEGVASIGVFYSVNPAFIGVWNTVKRDIG